MKTVFDPSFRYKPSFETNVRKTFERLRREQQAKDGGAPAQGANSDAQVKVLKLEQRKQGS